MPLSSRDLLAEVLGLPGDPEGYDPCVDDYATAYLNRADVKAAIHANPEIEWAECSQRTPYDHHLVLFLPPAQCKHGVTQCAAGVKVCGCQVRHARLQLLQLGRPDGGGVSRQNRIHRSSIDPKPLDPSRSPRHDRTTPPSIDRQETLFVDRALSRCQLDSLARRRLVPHRCDARFASRRAVVGVRGEDAIYLDRAPQSATPAPAPSRGAAAAHT